MKKNGVNSPDDFAKLSDEDREKLLKAIDKVINVEDDDTPEDDKEETPKDDAEKKDDVDLDDIEYYGIDPEDDEKYSPSVNLPLRDRLMSQFDDVWGELIQKHEVSNINLHYLDGKVEVEIELPLDSVESVQQAQALSEQFKARTLTVPNVTGAKVVFS